jgi:hypothetical protein
MAIFLLLPDLRRLGNFFILNRPTEGVRVEPLFRRPLWHRGALVFGSLFLIALVGTSLYQSYDQRRTYAAQRSPLYGVWEVEEFSAGQTAPAQRWQRIIFDSPRRTILQTDTNPHERFSSQLDQEKRTLTLRKRDDPSWSSVLSYEQVGPEVITLAGAFNGSEITARLHRSGERKFLLTDRGFHWINESPYNR